jgi:hypothetical protein
MTEEVTMTEELQPSEFWPNSRLSNRGGMPTSQSKIAWSFMRALETHLSQTERTRIFITLGAGENRAAITALLQIAHRTLTPLPVDLVDDVHRWLDGYAGTEYEAALRHLAGQLKTLLIAPNPPSTRVVTAAELFRR